VNRERAVSLLRRMVEIPSPSGEEGELAAFLASEMAGLGFRSHVDGAGNAVGEIGCRDDPLILLLGHMDTVPEPIPVREEGGVLYGRGAVDAKGALAAFVCAASALKDLPARVVVVGAVEEETASAKGARHLLDRYEPQAVIIGEPSGWSGVVLGYKGRVGLVLEVTRRPTHSSSPAEKAVEAAVAFWNRLTRHLDALDPARGLFHRPTGTLCRLDGSLDHARLEATCRIPPGFDVEGLMRFLDDERGQDTLVVEEATHAVVMDRTVPPARAIVGAIRRHRGTPVFKLRGGTSDMNVAAERWPAAMVAYGPGDSSLDHTPQERLDLEEFLRAIKVLEDAVAALAAELGAGLATARVPGPPPEVQLSREEEEEVASRLRGLGYLE
jgi:[amino group carrier protein]-lysine/ornithine hydrolase